MRTNMRSAFGLAALLVLAVGSGVRVPAQGPAERGDSVDVDKRPRISVSGTGKVSVPPDLADISVGVVTQEATARQALAANTEAMTRLMQVVKEQGVADKDVQTVNINVSPQYTQPPPQAPGQPQREFVPRIAAYQVTNTVQLTVRDLSKLGAVLDAVVSAGANQMYGINFRVDEPEKRVDEARTRAMADARRKAEQLATAAGVEVGPPLLITEGGGVLPPPQPMMRGRMYAMAAEAAPVPVAAGEQDLTVNVHVEYELRASK